LENNCRKRKQTKPRSRVVPAPLSLNDMLSPAAPALDYIPLGFGTNNVPSQQIGKRLLVSPGATSSSLRQAKRPRNSSSKVRFVVHDGESITLRPPRPYPLDTLARVSAARLWEHGWTKIDLCSCITRHPKRYSSIDTVLFYDIENVGGWFNIERTLPPNVLLCVFCGNEGVFTSFPLAPLKAGRVAANRSLAPHNIIRIHRTTATTHNNPYYV